MSEVTVASLFLVITAACVGGFLARYLRFPDLVGYLLAGIIIGAFFPYTTIGVSKLADLGVILLLFSIGVELSFEKLSRYFRVAIFGTILEIVLVSVIGYFALTIFGLSDISASVLALGFSLSSTAVVVKILSDREEIDTIHGGVMTGWLLVQDLAVVPILVLLSALSGGEEPFLLLIGLSLSKAMLVVVGAVLIGKIISPFVVHKVAATNSRELLLLTSVALALGTAVATSLFGISPALGAFLAGVAISESQENHAVFAETRPLRDLFVALFFVSLGFLVRPEVIFSHLFLIVGVTVAVIILKVLVVFVVSMTFGYKGKVAVVNSLGLAQVGEFAFVIYSVAVGLSLISSETASIGIAAVILTLLVSPLLFRSAIPFWRKLKSISKFFATGEKQIGESEALSGHIIICGFGRVGSWVGKAVREFGVPFVVVDYNQNVVKELKKQGLKVFYGDPTEPEVLELVGIREAQAVVLAIPDRIAQETLIAYIQSVAPNVKIISRAHQDTDWERFKTLGVDKVVQPEFEAAVEIARTILRSLGKGSKEVAGIIKKLKLAHSKK